MRLACVGGGFRAAISVNSCVIAEAWQTRALPPVRLGRLRQRVFRDLCRNDVVSALMHDCHFPRLAICEGADRRRAGSGHTAALTLPAKHHFFGFRTFSIAILVFFRLSIF